MFVEDGVSGGGEASGRISIFLGTFDLPSCLPFRPVDVISLSPSLAANVPIFLPPSRTDPPTFLQSSCISSFPCEPCPRSAHGPATEHCQLCPWASLLSSTYLPFSFSLACENFVLLLPDGGRYRIPRHIQSREASRNA